MRAASATGRRCGTRIWASGRRSTWAQLLDEVRAYAVGLHRLGLKRGDTMAIVGANRPRLYASVMAAQALGVVPVPVYADAVADELVYVLAHAEVRFAAVEDQEQVDKILSVSERLPKLETMVYDEPRGLRDYDHTRLHSMDDVIADGRKALAEDAGLAAWLDAEIAAGKGSDTSIILYTSGTTGQSKGVVLSAERCIGASSDTVAFDNLTEKDEALAYLPLAWVGDHYLNYAQGLVAGFCMACPESGDTAMADLREIGPTFFFAPPRTFEQMLTRVMIRMEDAGFIKRHLFHHFIGVARRYGEKILNKQPVPLHGRLAYWLGNILVYAPLKNVLGLSSVRVAYTAGEAIGPDLFSFYRSLGMNLKQLYGQTEAFLYLTAQPDGQIYADTVGPALPNVDLRIADNGEVQFKSPGMFVSYFKDDAKTKETMTRGRLCEDRRRRLLRQQDRASEDHRPRQGRRQAQGRHAVPAEVHREQAEVLSQHPRGGGLRRRPRLRRRDDQHRSHRGRKLGRAQQRGLWLLSGAGRPSAGLRHDPEEHRGDQPLARRGQGRRRARRCGAS